MPPTDHDPSPLTVLHDTHHGAGAAKRLRRALDEHDLSDVQVGGRRNVVKLKLDITDATRLADILGGHR